MEEDKITYARKFLLDLLEKRRLRSWCQESGALHISMFKIARGVMNPTYAVMCHLLPYIPPAHWVYFIDEENPYEVRTLPEWRPDAVSAFVRCHKRDWKEIGQRYGISEKPCGQYIREPPCASYGFPYTERKENCYTDMGGGY